MQFCLAMGFRYGPDCHWYLYHSFWDAGKFLKCARYFKANMNRGKCWWMLPCHYLWLIIPQKGLLIKVPMNNNEWLVYFYSYKIFVFKFHLSVSILKVKTLNLTTLQIKGKITGGLSLDWTNKLRLLYCNYVVDFNF